MALPPLNACRRSTHDANLRELKLAFVPRITVAGVYIAEEQGFFRDAGLKVIEVTQRRSEYIVPLLTGGAIDLGLVQIDPSLINALGSGARLRLVAGRDMALHNCGSVGTLYGMRKTFPNGFGNLRILKGKRIGVSSRSTNLESFSLDAILASAGMSYADVEVMQMEQSQSVTALVEGKIDATVANFIDSYVDALSPDIVRGPGLADLYPGMQYNFIAFGRSLLEGDPGAGVAFLTAFFRGVRAFAAGKYSDRLLQTLAREIGMDPKLAAQSCRSGSVLDGAIDVASIQRFVDWSVRKGFTSKAPAISEMIDTRFVNLMRGGGNGKAL